jgi:hypothetical protein
VTASDTRSERIDDHLGEGHGAFGRAGLGRADDDASLFTQTIALRLRSRDEVTMVLGEGLADNAPAHRISPDTPGTGYVISEDGAAMRIRADYWTDTQIRMAADEYRPQATNRER